jgi:hypothetical protein
MKPESKRKRVSSPEKKAAVGGQAVNVPGIDSAPVVPVPVGSAGGVDSGAAVLAPVGSGGGVPSEVVIPATVGSAGGTDSGVVIPVPVGSAGGTDSGAVIPVSVGSGGDGKAPANVEPSAMEGVIVGNEAVFKVDMGRSEKDNERKAAHKSTTNPEKLRVARLNKGQARQQLAREGKHIKLRTKIAANASPSLLTNSTGSDGGATAATSSRLMDGGHAENSPGSDGGYHSDDASFNKKLNDWQADMQEQVAEGEKLQTGRQEHADEPDEEC